MRVESQIMSARSPKFLSGDLSCILPVAAPAIPSSVPIREFIADKSNLSRLRVSVSFCSDDVFPDKCILCSEQVNSIDSTSVSVPR